MTKRTILISVCLGVAAFGVMRERDGGQLRKMAQRISDGHTIAWARHITGQDVNDLTTWDDFNSVAVIPGGAGVRHEDEVWVVTTRTIDGNDYRFIEQFTPLDWGSDPNYCWFVDCAGEGTSYQPGQAEVPEIPEVPASRPRPEALIVANGAGIGGGLLHFYDDEYGYITTIGTDEVAWTFDMTSDGIVYVGNSTEPTFAPYTTGAIWSIGVDYTLDKNVLTPTTDWPTASCCYGLRISDDDALLYASIQKAGFDWVTYCFDLASKTELWNVAIGGQCLAVDSENNVYTWASGLWGPAMPYDTYPGVMKYSSAGAFLKVYETHAGNKDIYIDEGMNRLFSAGEAVYDNPTYQLVAVDLDSGANKATFAVSTFILDVMNCVITDGTYVYACGTRNDTEFGVAHDGMVGTVWKLDSDLNPLAVYDPGSSASDYLWWDPNGNLVVKDTGVDKFIILDPTDLSLITSYDLVGDESGDNYAGEAMPIPYTIVGTPGVPGIPGVPEAWADGPGTQLGGDQVCVYADAVPRGTFTMDGNDILGFTEADYSVVIAGLNYYSIYESFPIVGGTQYGPTQTQKAQITDVRLDFFETLGANIGVSIDESSEIVFSEDDFATQLDPWTGPKVVSFPRGTSREPILYLWIWEPIPMCIRGLYPTANIFFEGD